MLELAADRSLRPNNADDSYGSISALVRINADFLLRPKERITDSSTNAAGCDELLLTRLAAVLPCADYGHYLL